MDQPSSQPAMSQSSSSTSLPTNPATTLSNMPIIEAPAIAKSLNHNLPIKLNRDNYVYWKALVLPAIRALELDDFINGACLCPDKYVEVPQSNGNEPELVINSKFLAWRRLDQYLLSWLLSTVSENLIVQVTDCVSSLEVWRTLERIFSQQSMAKILQLRQQLGSMKKGASSIAEFVLKIKNIGDCLKSAGDTVSDRDLVLSVVNGLGHEFDAVVVFITSQPNSIALHEAQYMLMIHEQRIEHLNSASQIDVSPSANFVNNASTGNQRGRGNYRGGNKGRDGGNRGRRGRGNWNNNSRPSCQICGRIGHIAARCYNRFDRNYQNPNNGGANNNAGASNTGNGGYVANHNQHHQQDNHNQGNFAAQNFNPQANFNQTSGYIATPESVIDPMWYADNGASSHVTSDLGQGVQEGSAQRYT